MYLSEETDIMAMYSGVWNETGHSPAKASGFLRGVHHILASTTAHAYIRSAPLRPHWTHLFAYSQRVSRVECLECYRWGLRATGSGQLLRLECYRSLSLIRGGS